MAKKRSFFERLTGSVRLDEEEDEIETPIVKKPEFPTKTIKPESKNSTPNWIEEDTEEGQLSVDVYQTPTDIVIQTMVAGVRPEDLQINISRDMVTVRGKREENKTINDENFFTKELYWGTFSRTISLPQEIDPEGAEAIEKHGLLMIRLPKLDKSRQTMLRVKSM